MKALVTGCAGFIGSHLTERLLGDGYEVIGLDCFSPYYPRPVKEGNVRQALTHPRFKLLETDILKTDDFPRVDYVFHQAAQPGVRMSWGKEFQVYVDNNVMATQRLLEHYTRNGMRMMVFASSSSVYGDAALPMREDCMLRPLSPYGVTKLAAESLCCLYHTNYGTPVISLRYFTVYGPRQRPDMALHKLVQAVLRNREFSVYGDGQQTRDLTYVSDVVEANVLAMSTALPGEVVNIGGGSRITLNELISRTQEVVGKKALIRYAEEQKGDARDTLADVSKAQRLLGWSPGVGIDQGLTRYVDWYRAREASPG